MYSVPFIRSEVSCRNQRAPDGLQHVHVVHERISDQQFLSELTFSLSSTIEHFSVRT